VGTWKNGMPRAKVAAMKPARSPITPPPTATIAVLRSAPSASSRSHSSVAVVTHLDCSPGSTTTRSTAAEVAATLSATASACGFSTFSSVITTACDSSPRQATNCPASARLPAPISMS